MNWGPDVFLWVSKWGVWFKGFFEGLENKNKFVVLCFAIYTWLTSCVSVSLQASWCAWTFSRMLWNASTMLRSVGNARSSSGHAPRSLCASWPSWWSTVSGCWVCWIERTSCVLGCSFEFPYNLRHYKTTVWCVLYCNVTLIFSGYIGEFEIIDDHRAGKIVVNLTGRLNKVIHFFSRYHTTLCEMLSKDVWHVGYLSN